MDSPETTLSAAELRLAASIQALEHIRAFAEYVNVDIVQALGELSISGSTESTQQLIDRAQDTADSVYQSFEHIFTAIAAAPVHEPWMTEPQMSEPTTELATIVETKAEPTTEPQVPNEQFSDPTLSQSDRSLLKYMFEKTGDIHIGAIVRGYIGTQRLPKDEHLALVGAMNRLADLGYLIHKPGQAYYRANEEYAPKKAIESVEQNKVDVDEIIDLRTIDTTLAAKPSEETEQRITAEARPPELSELESEIFAYLSTITEPFRLEEVRGDGPLSKLDKVAYEQFKKSFSALRKIHTNLLNASGDITAEWVQTGKARGTRYLLVSHIDVTDKAIDIQPESPAKVVREIVSPAPKNNVSYVESLVLEPEYSQFLKSLVPRIQERTEQQRVRKNELAAHIAEMLIITLDEGKAMVNLMEREAVIHASGTIAGSRAYAFDASVEIPKKLEKPAEPEIEEKDPWDDIDTAVLCDVYDQLMTKTHVQQGIQMKDMVANRTVEDLTDEEYRRRLRRLINEKLVVLDKNRSVARRSGHSKRIQAPAILFPSQREKDNWRKNRQEVIDGVIMRHLEALELQPAD